MRAIRQKRPAVILAALLLAGLFSVTCDSDENIPTGSLARPDKIKMISGDNQTGGYQTKLTQPFTVQVLDSDDNPVPSHKVRFEVSSGSGVLAGVDDQSLEVVTNSNGITSAYLVLGIDSVNTVTASATGATGSKLSGSPVTFMAFATSSATQGDTSGTGSPPPSAGDPVMADTILIVSGGNQTGEVNTLLPELIVVQVLDENGSTIAGVDVKFTITSGGPWIGLADDTDPGINNSLIITTDSDGRAAISMRMGPGPDLDMIVVAEVLRADGLPVSTTLSAQALPNPDTANRLVIMSGNNQGYDGEYAVGSLLPLPIVVRVVDTTRTGVNGDTLGAPISNFPVLMEAFSPGGTSSLSDEPDIEPYGTGRLTALTDADGLGAARWVLGTDTGGPDDLNVLRDNNIVVAVVVFADGSQDTVVFRATAVPQAPSEIAASGPTDRSATAGASLSGLGVTVTDANGNLVAGTGVSFSITQLPAGGSASLSAPSSVTTDIYGNASAALSQASTKVGDMKVAASSGTLNGSPVTFSITVSAGPPDQILASGGNGQSSKAGTAFSKPLIALVFDQYQNPVEGVLVTFAVTGGSASLETSAVFTDEDGLAETNCTPNAAGAITATATATIGGAPTSVTFNLTATAP
ncbi:MAG: hypothetical protein FVQ81_08830 [Candidatus Glassbacteria bacterium]|nr:hypothetical protein [Candidatus Glassbacteria bacterium]